MSSSVGSPGALHQAEGALTRAAGEVEAARSDLTAAAGRLDGRLAGMRSQWQGAGGSAFEQVHRVWQEQQRRIVGALDGLAQSLRDTDQAAVAADDAQAQTLARFSARLGGVS